MQDTITHDVIPYEGSMNETMRYSMVLPLAAPQEAAAAIAAYEALKTAVKRPDDVQKIKGRDFLKKSFWRRIATCFGLSLDLVSESRGFDEAGKLYYSVLYRAVAPNGRSMIGDGYCSTAEGADKTEHIVRATAHTRAKNRAISDLVGGGEVSAEEMTDDEPAPAAKPTPRPMPMKKGYATLPAIREERVEEIEEDAWAAQEARADKLGISHEDFTKAKKHYNTVARMAARLNEIEALRVAADDDFTRELWAKLRIAANERGWSVAEYEQLVTEKGRDYAEVEAKIIGASADLREVPALAGQKGRS